MATEYENVSLYATLTEDPGAPEGHLRPESVEKGAGELEIGANVDGTKVVLFRIPAGRFLKDQRLAQQKADENASTDAQPTQSY